MAKKYDWSKVTYICKTFLRDPYFYECVRTMRENYPKIKIVVADDGYLTDEKQKFVDKFVDKYYRLPFDMGLPYGRNYIVNKTKTPYVLIGDDDFFFTDKTNMEALYDLMEVCDVAGGRITEGGKYRNYQGFFEFKGDHLNYTKLTDVDPEKMPDDFWDRTKKGTRYKHCDLTFNFAMAKREVVKKALWDENIKVAYEHSDWFMSVKNAGFKTAFTPDACVVHKPEHIKFKSIEYKGYRSRKSDKEHFFKKWKIKTASDMNNNEDSLDKEMAQKIEAQKTPADIAYCISTFERPEKLRELLFSIVKHNKEAAIYIADDSKKFYAEEYKKLWDELFEAGLRIKPKAWNVPHDSGLSFKRNLCIRQTQEPYLLFLDDDFIFTEKTDIDKMLKVLISQPNIGIVGGAVNNNGSLMRFTGDINKIGTDIVINEIPEKPEYFDGIKAQKCGIMPNFMLAKRNFITRVFWDEKIKIHGEHSDFYLGMKESLWDAYYIPEVVIDHKHGKSEEYTPKRKRTEFFEYMLNKHKCRRLVTFNVAQEPDGKGGIRTYQTSEYR